VEIEKLEGFIPGGEDGDGDGVGTKKSGLPEGRPLKTTTTKCFFVT